jgi:hypothetical protein
MVAASAVGPFYGSDDTSAAKVDQAAARRAAMPVQGPAELVAGLGAGLELGRPDALPFVSVVIALYLVPKSTELFCVNVWVELDNQGALSVSIAPKFTGRAVLLAGWRTEHGTQLRLALADKGQRRTGRSGGECPRFLEVAVSATAAASVVDAGGVVLVLTPPL